jgi:uncharacterized protein HemX
MELAEECQHPTGHTASSDTVIKPIGFEQIYQSAAVKPSEVPYSILKVFDMAASSHLKGMTPEAKRCALLMALEAAGAGIEDLLQDAVARQRALNDYAEKQQDRLARFENQKAEENRTIQAELDRITGQYMARIQVNVDEVARQQDALLAWQKRKQEEGQRIADAASYLVPEGSSTHNGGLTAVLERATQSRRPVG